MLAIRFCNYGYCILNDILRQVMEKSRLWKAIVSNVGISKFRTKVRRTLFETQNTEVETQSIKAFGTAEKIIGDQGH